MLKTLFGDLTPRPVGGGTSTGKTTLLNALAAFLPADDRVVLIEDTAELQLDRRNIVRFEARREQPGLPAVTIRDLVMLPQNQDI